MRKGLIAILVVFLVAVGAIMPAGYFGQIAEQTLKSRMANMPYGLQMDMVEYERGWFSSTARLEWRPAGNLAIPAMPAQGPAGGDFPTEYLAVLAGLASGAIAVDLEIAHGPIFFVVSPGVGLFNARGRIDWTDAAAAAAAETEAQPQQDRDNSIDIHVSSFLGGTVTNRLAFEELDWRLGPVSMNLGGGRLDGEWTGPNAFQLQHLSLEKMDVYVGTFDAALRVSISDIESRSELPQGLESGAILTPSETNSSVGEVEIAGEVGNDAEENTVMRMTGLSSLDRTSVDEEGLYHVSSQMEIQYLELMGQEFAPVEMKQETGGFGEAAMLKLMAALSAGIFEVPPGLQSDEDPPPVPSTLRLGEGPPPAPPSMPAPPSPPDQALADALPGLTAEFRDAMRAMLTNGPYAHIEAVARYQGEQSLKLDLRQTFYPDRVPAGTDVASIEAILSALEYLLDIDMPKAVAGELLGEGLLQIGLAQGLLQQTDTAYSLNLAFGNGILELNGRSLPLPVPTAAPPPLAGMVPSPFNEDAASRFEEDPSSPVEEDGSSPFAEDSRSPFAEDAPSVP